MVNGISEKGRVILIALVAGAIAGFLTSYFLDGSGTKTENELIAEFYDVENAAHVSPHGVRKHLAEGNTILVDLRSQEEYETEHIITAVSVPAYATPDKSDYGAVDRIVNSFRKLEEDNPYKEIVVYCYSTPCMTGRKVGKMLAENGIYVKHLGIGWNEWRYFWNKWNHDGETQVDPSDFVISGSEPGELDAALVGSGCPIEGGFGC